ncbi:MAG: type II secretion system protein [Verrucomicrobia bacterium]|nr:type II secretion system protein [Verrucomicrobiota bacterium]
MNYPLSQPAARCRRAFTLPELLVVIGIIGVLASLTVGGVAKVKGRAQRAECLSNLRQLMIAWLKHPGENDDRLVLNYRPHSGTNNPPPLPWVQGDYHYTYDSVTNSEFLTDPKLAAFASTIPNPRVYRCPAVRHDVQGIPLTRSFGLNQYMGAGSRSETDPAYATFARLPDVANPAGIFTFLELNPHTICTSMARVPMDTNAADGYFHMPSFLHGGRAVMAFADGHVDAYGIRDKDTLRTYRVDWLPDHHFTMTNADVLAIRDLTTYQK